MFCSINMYLNKLTVVLFCFTGFFLNLFSQQGTIDFSNYKPSGCNTEPELTIGLIADPQYCDSDPAGNRYYREVMWKLPQAVDTMNKYHVDFVMNLGDMTDQYYESFDSVSKHYEKLTMPYYNLLGNHDFYGIDDELKSIVISRFGMPGYYYSFCYGDWRFLILDGTELAEYARFIHPELSAEGDSVWNSVQGKINDEIWNGGIGKTQQAWMHSVIEEAADSGQNVILFCHFPVYPDSSNMNLWNKDEIVNLIEQYPNVVAYINGHLHEGNYGLKNNIHYLSQAAMLDTPDTNSFAILRIYSKELRIEGYGRVPDKILSYSKYKKEIINLFLSDTVLNYACHKNDLVGYISFSSPDTAVRLNFVLDTTRFENRYFRINGDSLILNTNEDLSVEDRLKVKIIAVDCAADTFSQTFDLLFDTVVMKYKYLLPDTELSIYDNYCIDIDSLIEDNSNEGLDYSLYAAKPGMISFLVSDDTINLIPEKVGATNVTLIETDPYTGKSYLQTFHLVITDPLNNPPYHTDSVNTGYIMLLKDTINIQMSQLIIDPDGDSIDYYLNINDTNLLKGWFQDDFLYVSGLNSGLTLLTVSACDNRGGSDSVMLSFRINTAPLHSDTTKAFYLFQLNDLNSISLSSIFHDPDGDNLLFSYISSDTFNTEALIMNDSLFIRGIHPGMYVLCLIAEDDFGGSDTLNLQILVNARPSSVYNEHYIIYHIADEQLTIDLDTFFYDANEDSLSYSVSHVENENMFYNLTAGILTIHPLSIDTINFYVTAYDGYGGSDSLKISLLCLPELNDLTLKPLINALIIYPNPASGILNLQFDSDYSGSASVQLTDLNGRVLFYADGWQVYQGTNFYALSVGKIETNKICVLLLTVNHHSFVTTGIVIR